MDYLNEISAIISIVSGISTIVLLFVGGYKLHTAYDKEYWSDVRIDGDINEEALDMMASLPKHIYCDSNIETGENAIFVAKTAVIRHVFLEKHKLSQDEKLVLLKKIELAQELKPGEYILMYFERPECSPPTLKLSWESDYGAKCSQWINYYNGRNGNYETLYFEYTLNFKAKLRRAFNLK